MAMKCVTRLLAILLFLATFSVISYRICLLSNEEQVEQLSRGRGQLYAPCEKVGKNIHRWLENEIHGLSLQRR